MPPQPAVRATRHQAAKAQAGQYSYNSSDLVGSRDSSMVSQRFREIDFITLFGGRSKGSNRSYKEPTSRPTYYQGLLTNHNLHLAKEQAIAQDILNNREALSTPIQPPTYKEASGLQGTNESGISRTPIGSPVKTLEEVERDCGADETATLADDAGEDSFVHQITCRSPAKPVSRIEDSVEALDQLEEAIEALGQAALAEAIMSPAKTRKKSPLRGDSLERKNVSFQPEPKVLLHQSGGKQQAPRAGFATVRMKTAPKQAPTLKKAASMNFTSGSSNAKSAEAEAKAPPPARAPVKRPISLLPPKETTKSTKAPTRSTFELPGEAVAQKLKEQREARLAQRQSSEDSFYTARVVSGPKVKSTKPPTKPTFELPGEELSRRKRAAHEARLRAQEEEERKRREFKAKPIRNSNVPNMVPRETIASRARQSKIGMEGLEEGNFSVAKRGSNIGAHRPTISQLNLANTSAPRTKGAATLTRKPSLTVHGPSMSGRAMQRSVSVTDIQVQRQRAKEIYNREARMAEDMEREKRDREIAAKRAREEAAERGRQASREWAERQMARKLAEGDKGLSAGYGPGGQLGLSG